MIKKILLGIIILLIFYSHLNYSDAATAVQRVSNATGTNCLTITGKFTARGWDSSMGNGMMVGCGGDYGTAGCRGQVATVTPGHSYKLTKCSCAPYGDPRYNNKGCLVIGKKLKLEDYNTTDRNGNRVKRTRVVKDGSGLPNICKLKVKNKTYSNTDFFPTKAQFTANSKVSFCGKNGQSITGNFSISCQTTPVPTDTPVPTETPIPTRTLTPTPTLTPVPSVCVTPAQVQNVKITCPNCNNESPTPTPTNTPTPTPTLTPTPTPTPGGSQ